MKKRTRRPPFALAWRTLAGILLLLPAGVPAQEPGEHPLLPDRTEAGRLVGIYNAPGTIRLPGGSVIPPEASIRGDVATLGGTLVVGGIIEGELVVLNGDLRILQGARFTGRVTVVGGQVREEEGTVRPVDLVVYPGILPFSMADGMLRYEPDAGSEVEPPLRIGGSRFMVRAEGAYNRVEGLPVSFGPTVETGSRNPLRVQASGIWRSEGGARIDGGALGYRAKLEQSLGGRDELRAGISFHSVVVPIETLGYGNIEASLSTFLLHRDLRDHREEEGWSAYLDWRPRTRGIRARVEFADSEHRTALSGSPWSITDNDQPWRPQPAIGEGPLRTLRLSLRYDARNDLRNPTDGWLLAAEFLSGLGGALRRPGLESAGGDTAPDPAVLEPVDLDEGFRHGRLEVERHGRTGPGSVVRLRMVVAGTLTGDPLPPQFQHAAGGSGTLPAFAGLSLDCGARDWAGSLRGARSGGPDGPPSVHPGYGCDRIATAHVEFRNAFGSGSGDDGTAGSRLRRLDPDPAWSLFFDVGRGWSFADRNPGQASFPGRDSGTRSDLGAGLHLGRVGLHLAVPLRGGGPSRFFIRLSPRFGQD